VCAAAQERNRPTQPPKKPEAAPFFLPTVAGLEGTPVFDTSAAEGPGAGDDAAGARSSLSLMQTLPAFTLRTAGLTFTDRPP
jgi:U3 small nucleolar RNA-associated protein 21